MGWSTVLKLGGVAAVLAACVWLGVSWADRGHELAEAQAEKAAQAQVIAGWEKWKVDLDAKMEGLRVENAAITKARQADIDAMDAAVLALRREAASARTALLEAQAADRERIALLPEGDRCAATVDAVYRRVWVAYGGRP